MPHQSTTFAELSIGDRFTNNTRLLNVYWTKMRPCRTGRGCVVNAVSSGGWFVFFADAECVIGITVV